MKKPFIISVTGTKGKTTVVNLVDAILHELGENTLRVDTTGHFVNGTCRSTLEDSREIWGLEPSVCPGRYLFECMSDELRGKEVTAVLETAIGSSSLKGLGYSWHHVGVFLNVFEDHIGSSERIQSKADIASAKDFIFRRLDLHKNAVAVFNADDELVCSKLNLVKKHVTKIPCGLDFRYYNLNKHLQNDGFALTIRDKQIILLARGGVETVLCDTTKIPQTFDGEYMPTMTNVMFALATVFARRGCAFPDNIRTIVESVNLDPRTGRMAVLTAANGVMVIADFAHEKVSLKMLSDLAKNMARKRNGKLIGVVRLAPDRPKRVIEETAKVIANGFDDLIVYDKIDGYWRHPALVLKADLRQEVGKVSTILVEAIRRTNPNVKRIIREDYAIAEAANDAKPEDVVVVILNDNTERSIEFIKEKFHADFI